MRLYKIITCATLLLLISGCSLFSATGLSPRPSEWAQPIDRPGLPNLYKVDDHLYRGAQPTADGIGELKKMGIRTVINLRALHSDRDEIGDTEIGYVHIPMTAINAHNIHAIAFLQTLLDPTKAPVFVHCQHGADRTGTIVAVYRILIHDWTKKEALREMIRGGYGFHTVFEGLIKFIEDLDVEEIKRGVLED